MLYLIDNNMPMPPIKRSRLYPFANMQPGDSFKVPREQDHRLRSAAYYYARKHGMKFTVARMEDGVRCWRVN